MWVTMKPRWPFLTLLILLTACSDATGPALAPLPERPADARFVTTDIANFWRAYDAGASADAFQREYLNKASAGLRDFITARSLTATSLVQMVRAYPRYFADVRPNTLRLTGTGDATVLARIRASYDNIEALYPAAVFPPVTFLVGRFSTGGTVRESGILIGTEFYALGPTTPVDELQQFHRDVARPLDSIPVIIAHEHTHVLQARTEGILQKPTKTLLDQALIEGIADFVGELASGTNVNEWLRAYAVPREVALWNEFKLEMGGTNVSRWLYNQGNASADRPGDLGYFIGYQIAKAYHDRATDKRDALRQIIEVRDGTAFLAASGYTAGR